MSSDGALYITRLFHSLSIETNSRRTPFRTISADFASLCERLFCTSIAYTLQDHAGLIPSAYLQSEVLILTEHKNL
jgi:hypothetical protein